MGAAFATLASVIGIAVFLRGRHGIQLQWRAFAPDPHYIKRAFFLGLPGSVELSTRGLGLTVMSFLVASFGTLTIAAYGVGSNVLQVVTIPVIGVSMAVSTLVELGALLSFCLLTLLGMVAWLCAPWLVRFFIPDDANVIAEGAHFIRIMCLAWGGIGIQLCIVSAFHASGNMLIAMIIAMVSQWMIQFPLDYVLSKHTVLQAQGIWWSFPATNLAVSLISICSFQSCNTALP